MPETIEAFTVVKCPGGWSFLTMTLDQEMNVVNCKKTEPNMKALAIESFKLAVGKYWSKQEG